jgi:neutral ceramidase
LLDGLVKIIVSDQAVVRTAIMCTADFVAGGAWAARQERRHTLAHAVVESRRLNQEGMIMSDTFLAGAATRSIMPPAEMVDNTLHPMMTVRFDEPGSPVQAKALALTLGQQSVMLIGLDLGGASDAQADHLRCAVAEALGLTAAQVVISCTHSHSTPGIEPLTGAHPYFDLVVRASVQAAGAAWTVRRGARIGHGRTYVVGASFNQRVPLADGGVKFTRDYREGLASGRPVNPQLTVIRIDDERGGPIAGWIHFAAHPACVIFNAPLSAEYPGYMTDQLSQTVAGGAPVIYAFGAAGDVNCVPMFGTEQDARNLGLNLAALAAPVFENIETHTPKRLCHGTLSVQLPLDDVPSIETLDREIAEVSAFVEGLDEDPELDWILGVNCWRTWSVAQKRAYAKPLGAWSQRMKAALQRGEDFPTSWPVNIAAWVVDDLGLIFYGGEAFTAIGLEIAVGSPLGETLVICHCNGMQGYLGTDADMRRGGYEVATWHRHGKEGMRSRAYALGAADMMIDSCLVLLKRLHAGPVVT